MVKKSRSIRTFATSSKPNQPSKSIKPIKPSKPNQPNHDDLLSTEPPARLKKVTSIINKIQTVTSNLPINEILLKNPHEKMVPLNLWFKNDDYVIQNYNKNDQNIRIRHYKSMILTPLVKDNCANDNLQPIRPIINNLSLYQPFFPENYYQIWEFLQTKYISDDLHNFLFIGNEDRQGAMEALILYNERYQKHYQNNIYHSWICGREIYNGVGYDWNNTCINYLDQTYDNLLLESTNQLIKYDFVIVDCIGKMTSVENICEWQNEECDLEATLFYVLTIIGTINVGGSLLLRVNMIGRKNWLYVWDLLSEYFSESSFMRPTMIHKFNSELYLLLSKRADACTSNKIGGCVIKNMYRQKIYTNFFLNLHHNPLNPIIKKYHREIDKWYQQVNTDMEGGTTSSCISTWHLENDLLQIKNVKQEHMIDTVAYVVRSKNPSIKIKLGTADTFYNLQAHAKLSSARRKLNYFKRVMDTKPSRIYLNNRQKIRGEDFLTWETLTFRLDLNQELKYELRKHRGGEMITNAWIKMYEMINRFPKLLPQQHTIIKTFHLCEAPGAFIAAINHYLSIKDINFDWYAQTLVPMDNSRALDDHFGLVHAYPHRWIFGDPNGDNSGDISHSAVIKHYMKHELLKGITFMTSDAGILCNPKQLNEQESYLSKINMGQIVCILACLEENGSAIFKTFLPLSEPLNISMIHLLTKLFDSLTYCKPSSSYACNSEIYIILQGYHKIKPNILEILLALLDDPNITSKSCLFDFDKAEDKVFLDSHTNAITAMVNRQIAALGSNYYYYYNFDKITTHDIITGEYCDKWLRENFVKQCNKRLL